MCNLQPYIHIITIIPVAGITHADSTHLLFTPFISQAITQGNTSRNTLSAYFLTTGSKEKMDHMQTVVYSGMEKL